MDILQSPGAVDPATGLLKGSFGFGTYEAEGKSFPGIVKPEGDVIDLSGKFRDCHEILDDWDRNFDVMYDLAQTQDGTLAYDAVRPLPPLAHPNLHMAGANYKQHAAEMLTHNRFNQHNRRPGESDADFFKRNYAIQEERSRVGVPYIWPTLHSALMGAKDDLVLPALGYQHDWELELGVVVANPRRFATLEEAETMVAGYTVFNDLATAELARRTDIHFEWDFTSKCPAGFKICGPFIVPRQFIKLGEDIRIHLMVNGEDKQDWPVSDMIFSPAQFITFLSERLRLMAGDIIATGSPPGNGAYHKQFLKEGDLLESELTYLGKQVNRCVAEDVGGRVPVYDTLTAGNILAALKANI